MRGAHRQTLPRHLGIKAKIAVIGDIIGGAGMQQRISVMRLPSRQTADTRLDVVIPGVALFSELHQAQASHHLPPAWHRGAPGVRP